MRISLPHLKRGQNRLPNRRAELTGRDRTLAAGLSIFRRDQNQIAESRNQRRGIIPTKLQREKLPDLRKQRQREERSRRLSELARSFKSKLKLIVGILIAIAVVAVVGFLIYIAHREEVYVIKDIQISGNVQASKVELLAELQKYQGSSLLLVRSPEIESDLKVKFPYLKAVYTRKILPGTLDVEVVERFPILAYVNLSGVYLIDEDQIVATILVSNEVAQLTSDEKQILAGLGDWNANYVYEHYLSEITDDKERAKVKWDEVDPKTKNRALSSLQKELETRVNSLLNENLNTFAQSQFNELPKVIGLDSNIWRLGDKFDSEKYSLSSAVTKYLQKIGWKINELRWISDFTLDAKLKDGRQVYFTTTRDTEDQLNALEALRTKVDIKGVTEIDVRGTTVAVK